MKKYIIIWNAGYGESADVIEAESIEKAETEAYDCWKEEAESSAEYRAEEYTDDLAYDYGLSDE